MPALTKRLVDSAKPKQLDYFLWCSSTPGFGLRVYPSGKRVFVCQIRVGRATRRIKIGLFGQYTVEQARQRAHEILRAASGYQRMVARAGEAAGFPFLVHSHMLRHSCGYKLANDGQDTRAIQHYLGHKSINSTVRYTALAPDRFKGFWKD